MRNPLITKPFLNRTAVSAAVIVLLLLLGGINLFYPVRLPLLSVVKYWQARLPASQSALKPVRELKANHQLSTKDFEKPLESNPELKSSPLKDIIGKYITVDKGPGDEIKPQEISDTPQISPLGPDFMAVVYSLTEKQMANLELIDIGSQIKICAPKAPETPKDGSAPVNNSCISEPVEILAVHQKTSDVSSDWLLLKIRSDKTEELAKIMALDNHVILIIKNQ